MIADVILGRNIDTSNWIKELKTNLNENIIVIDYEHTGEPETIEDIIYLSPLGAQEFLAKYDSINFYKSMYIYPGIYNLKQL